MTRQATRGLGAALAATAALYALQTLASLPAVPMHVAFAIADGVMVWALFRLRRTTALATLALVLAVFGILTDASGSTVLGAGEPLVSFVLAVLLLFVLRATGHGNRALFVATSGVLVLTLWFLLYRLGAEHRAPALVWASWSVEIARSLLLAATALTTEPKPAPEPPSAGPYRAPGEMPPPSVSVDWAPLADALARLRKLAIARLVIGVGTALFLVVTAFVGVDVFWIFAILAFLLVRAVSGALIAESADRARRSGPPGPRRALAIGAGSIGVASLVDLALAITFFLALAEEVKSDTLILLGLLLDVVLSLVATGALGRAMEATARELERTDLLVRARRILLVAVTIVAATLLAMGLFATAEPFAAVAGVLVLLAVVFALVYGQVVEAGTYGALAAAANANRS